MHRFAVRLVRMSVLVGPFLASIVLVLNSPVTWPVWAAANGRASAGRSADVPATPPFTIALQPVVSGLSQPVYLTHAGDGSERLFVVEQEGRIRVVKNGVLQSAPFLSITHLVQCCGEQGLLSVAFDPDYETNGAFYVNYTRQGDGDSVIARYVVADPASDVASVVSVTQVLTVVQPQTNHNGGQLQFGPHDDYLYIGMGDGGAAGDQGDGHHEPGGNAQWPGTLLGKVLRIDVRGALTYTIPPSNPFTQTAGYRPEIWALGLRNPWRFSFDRATGDMLIGDVGQGSWEEVSYQPASSAGGTNYGWRCKEGLHDFNMSGDCPNLILTSPVVEYPQVITGEDNCSVIGGYVYRGGVYPWLNGVNFYADYCSGRIWSLEQVSPGIWSSVEQRNESFSISSFGEDEDGELVVLDYSGGRVLRLTSTAAPDLSLSQKIASNVAPMRNQTVAYTIVLRNAGSPFSQTVRLTDVVPFGLAYVAGSLAATHGAIDDSSAPMLKWSGVMSSTFVATVTYAVTVTETVTKPIANVVTIDPGIAPPFVRPAIVFVNGHRLYLPVITKRD